MSKRVFITLIAAATIHAVFSIQAIVTARHGGMIHDEAMMFVFYPHVMLMFLLPPAYPINFGSGGIIEVDWLRFTGKLAVAIPASLLYGIVVASVWMLFIKKMPNQSTEPTLASGTSPAGQDPRLP
jgi:hypothetical protein